jgi:hypothetical protein
MPLPAVRLPGPAGILNERALASWVAAAEKALETNASTFAMVHIREILAPTGVIARLQAKGYTVEPPK